MSKAWILAPKSECVERVPVSEAPIDNPISAGLAPATERGTSFLQAVERSDRQASGDKGHDPINANLPERRTRLDADGLHQSGVHRSRYPTLQNPMLIGRRDACEIGIVAEYFLTRCFLIKRIRRSLT
jgi:hypothetical protein